MLRVAREALSAHPVCAAAAGARRMP
jgi:hypothetical protein